jgi:hypothetical protein
VVIDERLVRLGAQGGWIAVDLDGTALVYDKWVAWNAFGEPIWPMIERIKAWRAAGIEVRWMTARVFPFIPKVNEGAWSIQQKCRMTDRMWTIGEMITAIQAHTEPFVGERLPCTCAKDVDMIEQWDDRAVQVVANTGQTLAQGWEAEREALHGKVFKS